jgi:hypothetical protein
MSQANSAKSNWPRRWLPVTVAALILIGIVGLTGRAIVQISPESPKALVAPSSRARQHASSAFWSNSTRKKQPPHTAGDIVSPHFIALQNALERAMLETNPMKRSAIIEGLAAEVADGEIAGVLKALTNRELGTEFASLLVRRWAGTDPDSVAGWIDLLSAGPVRAEMMSQLAIIWAGTDPAGAIAWLDRLPKNPSRTTVTMTLAAEIARTDQPAALQIASTLPPTPDRDSLITHTIGEWAATDPQAAANWIGQLENQSLRDRLIGGLAASIAKRDGAGAANLVANELPPGDLQGRTAVAVALRWAQTEPDSAVDWVSRFPDGPLRETTLENLASLSRSRNQPPAPP